jgi:hypothetical protein
LRYRAAAAAVCDRVSHALPACHATPREQLGFGAKATFNPSKVDGLHFGPSHNGAFDLSIDDVVLLVAGSEAPGTEGGVAGGKRYGSRPWCREPRLRLAI